MWINSKQRAEPYLGLTCWDARLETGWVALRGETCTGAAWLSSARAVRCRVKSHNERNPCRQLISLARLPRKTGRKAGMTSNQHGLYALGHTHATMGGTTGS